MGCQTSSAVDCCADTATQDHVAPAPPQRTGAALHLTTAANAVYDEGSVADRRPQHFRSLSLTTAEEFGAFVGSGSTVEMGSPSGSPTGMVFVSPPTDSAIENDNSSVAAVTIPARPRLRDPVQEANANATIPATMDAARWGAAVNRPPPPAATAAVEGTPLWNPPYTVRSPSPFSLTGNRLEDQIRENQLHRALQGYCFNLGGRSSNTGNSPSPPGAHEPAIPTCSPSAPVPRQILHHTRSNSKVRIILPPVEVEGPSFSLSPESLSDGSSGVLVSREDVHCSVDGGHDEGNFIHQQGLQDSNCHAPVAKEVQAVANDDALVYSDAQVFDPESSVDAKVSVTRTSDDAINHEGFVALG